MPLTLWNLTKPQVMMASKTNFYFPLFLILSYHLFFFCLMTGWITPSFLHVKTLQDSQKGKYKHNIWTQNIGLLSTIGKLFEKIFADKIYCWAEENHILNNEQSGFRAKRSTVDKLFQLINDHQESKIKGERIHAVFYFKKAFDKVNHSLLLPDAPKKYTGSSSYCELSDLNSLCILF